MVSSFYNNLELLDGLETDNIKMLYYDLPNHFYEAYRTDNNARLCTIVQGEKRIDANNATLTYNPNHFLLLSPNSKVEVTTVKPTIAVVYEISSRLIEQVSEKISNEYLVNLQYVTKNQFFFGRNNINHILKKITEGFLDKNDCSKFLVDLYSQELVYHLIQNKVISQIFSIENNNPINKAIRYMYNNYTQPIDIRQMAYDLNMSESNFCQYFKKITKITPSQYFTNIKLQKAKEMLQYGNVTETAFNLGYQNISYFIMLFKKMYGITPKQYKMGI
nr:helix-turn-helix domain-containing protein [uncultured Caproiciproducens sp.]